jgi:hypothetical protein
MYLFTIFKIIYFQNIHYIIILVPLNSYRKL